MKKIIVIFMMLPFLAVSQSTFDSLEDNDEVKALVIDKNMFKMMSNIDISSDDPEAKDYLNLIKNIENLKVFATEDSNTAIKMDAMVTKHLNNSNLKELMRVKDKGTNVKFYMREGSTSDKVGELLMFVKGSEVKVDGEQLETVILSLTGDIDLKQVSKLTEKMNIPGGEHLKKTKNKS